MNEDEKLAVELLRELATRVEDGRTTLHAFAIRFTDSGNELEALYDGEPSAEKRTYASGDDPTSRGGG